VTLSQDHLACTQRQPSSALESIFISVVSALEAEMVFIRNLVGGLLAELEDDINHDKFKRLLHYSRRLTSFQNRVKLVTSYLLPPISPSDYG
jgi:magnesium transporter